jgi:plastocyanin
MNKTGWAVVAVAVLAIAGGAWWYVSKTPAQEGEIPPQGQPIPGTGTPVDVVPAPVDTPAEEEEPASASAPMTATITYSDSGFTPATVTIKKGGTVTWVNNSSGTMWVASAQHPTHTGYAGTSRQQHCGSAQESSAFDQCRGEEEDWSFTFSKTGEWAYHDHINASRFGRIEVVE